MTNYEQITNMTPKELALYLSKMISCTECPAKNNCHNLCSIVLKDWLESEENNE